MINMVNIAVCSVDHLLMTTEGKVRFESLVGTEGFTNLVLTLPNCLNTLFRFHMSDLKSLMTVLVLSVPERDIPEQRWCCQAPVIIDHKTSKHTTVDN